MARLRWNGAVQPKAVWPQTLGPGATVGLFAPAHKFEIAELERGVALLKSWGLGVKIPGGVYRQHRYLAGADLHRLDVLAELMNDPAVAGLMAIRGGYGCQRLLPGLADLWATWPPKPIWGFSDLTALHLARFKATGVIGLHGPMVVSLGKSEPGLLADGPSQADLKKSLLTGGGQGGWSWATQNVYRAGQAAGPLLGGNLTLVTALLSSPWLPDFKGAILMLEEVDEPPYRLDRLLITLRQSRIWNQASALVFGGFARCGPPAEVRRLLREAADDFPGGPVLFKAPFGHLSRNRLFPVGAWATLEA